MTTKEAVKILKLHNKWRRGDEKIQMTDPTQLGIAIDIVVKFVEKTLKTKPND